MVFSSVTQSLRNIDYDWTKPQTYFVFIPGLSLLVQKIQLASALPLSNDPITPENAVRLDAESRKFANICKWHLRGSMTQLAIAAIVAKTLLTVPFSLFFVSLTAYEMLDTLITSLRNRIQLFEFYPNGNIKSITFISACNIF